MSEWLYLIVPICIALVAANLIARKLYKKRAKRESQKDIYPLW